MPTVNNNTIKYTKYIKQIVTAWNDLEEFGIKPISKMTASSKRYTNLVARIREFGADDILAAIENIKTSDFLQGKNKFGFTVSFDWFVKPTNFPKVLEGNYNNRGTPQNKSSTAQMLDDSYQMMSDWAQRKKAEEFGYDGG